MHDEEPKKVWATKYASQNEVYAKYSKCRGMRGVVISKINALLVQFATQPLSCKILHNFSKDECPVRVVVAVERCLAGVQMA
jgi:hypothetical protein